MTIIKTFDVQEQRKKFPRKLIVLAFFGLFILTLIEIWASNTAVAFGEKFDKLSILQKNLEMENRILENEIAKNSSLLNIASKGAELGFLQSESIQYIRR